MSNPGPYTLPQLIEALQNLEMHFLVVIPAIREQLKSSLEAFERDPREAERKECLRRCGHDVGELGNPLYPVEKDSPDDC